MRRTFGRSKKGQPAKEVVSNNRGVNISVLGVIAVEGIVNLSLRKPQAATTSKKRKLQNGEERLVSKVGTRAHHFCQFMETVMNVFEKNDMRGRIFIMDNASIHHSSIVKDTVENHGFHILYLPPYSPVLNPIEEFWSKLKAGVKREIFTTSNPLAPRIIQSAYLVTARDCQGWIRHVKSYFPRCILEEPML